MKQAHGNKLSRILERAVNVEPNEVKATAAAFLFGFILMASYYILRPIRDALTGDWSPSEIATLWTFNFFISAAVVILYGFAVSRVKFRYIVPGVYIFFAASFIFFYLGSQLTTDRTLVDKSFYVWISVFAMLHLSVFWSYMSDLFNKGQAKRLFAIIASGTSAGALIGPVLPTFFAGTLGTDTLMLIAAVILVIPVPLIFYLARLKVTELGNAGLHADLTSARIGGNPFSGFWLFLTSPYLMAIGAFILLYTMISSFVYFEQAHLLEPFSMAERTTILGSISLMINILIFIIAFFATSRIVQKFGMGITLALMPVLVVAGMVILAFAPIISVLIALQVGRGAGNYAITKPGREMLFTEVDQETRYKAKPVIDVVVYRGGDTITAWFFTGLTEGLGLAYTVVGLIGAAIAAVWAAVGLYLGRVYESKRPAEDEENLVESVVYK